MHFTTAGQCGLMKSQLAHHNWEVGVNSQPHFSKLLLKKIVLVDNSHGLQLLMGVGRTDAQFLLEDSLIIG